MKGLKRNTTAIKLEAMYDLILARSRPWSCMFRLRVNFDVIHQIFLKFYLTFVGGNSALRSVRGGEVGD